MQVFKAFFKIGKSRLNTTLIYFGIYAALSVMLTFSGQSNYTDQFKATALDIAVTDEDESACSQALLGYLASLHNFADVPGGDEAVFDQMYYRTLDYAVTIPDGFEESLRKGATGELVTATKIPGSVKGSYVDQQISQYIGSLEMYVLGGYSLEDAIAKTDDALKNVPAVETVSFHTAGTAAGNSAFYYFQYLPYVYLVVLLCGLAPILITLNSSGILARTSCSSLSAGHRYRQLSAGCVLYGLATWFLFVLLAAFIYQGDIFGTNCLFAVLNSFVFLLFAVAFTLLVSCFAPDDNVLNMIANVVGLSMAFLCGVFVPQQILPASVLEVARFLPAYWYIRANNMLGGFGKEVFDMDFYWQCIGIQLLFVIACFVIAFVAARYRKRH